MYINESITKYISDLAAKKPAPGGGSASALCGALGVALLEMVCNFTLGKEKYKDVEQDIRKYLASLTKIREDFTALIDEDVKAYTLIQPAFGTKDKKIIDKALKNGYYISLKICKFSKNAMELAVQLPEKGNVNLITDVGCGGELLNAAFNSGIFNCEINLKEVEDVNFVGKEKLVLSILKNEVGVLYKDIISKTKEKMR